MEDKKIERECIEMFNEDGKKFDVLIDDEFVVEGIRYFIVLDAKDADNPDCEYDIIKEVMEDGKPVLISVDDMDEFNKVADLYDDYIASVIDYDA